MIHSARPIVAPVANFVFCCFVFLDVKSGYGRTDNMCENKPAVTLGWPSGSKMTNVKFPQSNFLNPQNEI